MGFMPAKTNQITKSPIASAFHFPAVFMSTASLGLPIAGVSQCGEQSEVESSEAVADSNANETHLGVERFWMAAFSQHRQQCKCRRIVFGFDGSESFSDVV